MIGEEEQAKADLNDRNEQIHRSQMQSSLLNDPLEVCPNETWLALEHRDRDTVDHIHGVHPRL